MVQASTIATLIDSGAEAVGALVKDRMVQAREREQMEAKMEHEKELARIQSDSDTSPTSTTPDPVAGGQQQTPEQPTPDSPDTHPGESVDMDTLLDGEDCSMCRAMLSYIREQGPDKRAEGIRDYGRMKQAMDSEGTEEAVRSVINESPVLQEAMSEAA